ncbi:MAG TPA: hypothetical protein VKD04_04970 [Burkholderiales bacterium]|nr:hypothetical protein [Burkholderiales bacterium]
MIGVADAGENPLVPDAASAGTAVQRANSAHAVRTSAAMALEWVRIALKQSELRIAGRSHPPLR